MSYRRILLKLSGESLHGPLPHGIHRPTLAAFAQEILAAQKQGSQVAVLIGGGNLFRGAQLTQDGYARVTGDQIGLLATVINGLALQDVLEGLGAETRLMTSVQMDEIAEPYIRRRAVRHLELRRIVILVAGMGRPYFSTDTAAVQRALELGADLVIKGTRVDGVYDKDPEKHPDAKFYDCLSFAQALEEDLHVMDTSAFALCRDNNLPIIVLNIHKAGTLTAALGAKQVGTLVNAAGIRS